MCQYYDSMIPIRIFSPLRKSSISQSYTDADAWPSEMLLCNCFEVSTRRLVADWLSANSASIPQTQSPFHDQVQVSVPIPNPNPTQPAICGPVKSLIDRLFAHVFVSAFIEYFINFNWSMSLLPVTIAALFPRLTAGLFNCVKSE